MVKVTTFGTTIVYVRGRTKTCEREKKNMVEKTLYSMRTWQSAQIVKHETHFKSHTIEKILYKKKKLNYV
jgi:hypothetical protein